MSNVIRLVSGGSIQVRTGVLQGVGPQGPRGVAGETGPDGPAGPPGPQGDMGVILQRAALQKVGSNNALTANTDTVISFGQVFYDDMLGFSLSAFTVPADGDYLLAAYLRFDDAAATLREMWFLNGTTVIARRSAVARVGEAFFLDLSFPCRAEEDDVIQVIARTQTATGVSDGSWTVTRMGSGPVGPRGIQGVTGPAGPTGATGAQGIPGTANAGFTKYSDLLPH